MAQEESVQAQTSQDAEEKSRQERELILKEARLEAENISKDARRRVSKLQDECDRLIAQKQSFVRRMKLFLNSQNDLIDMFENEDDK